MHFSPLLISSFLLLTPAVPAFLHEFRRSPFNDLVEKRTDAVPDIILSSAGASWLLNDGGAFRFVSGTLTLPMLLLGQEGSAGVAHISIGAFDPCGATLEIGISFQHTPSGPIYKVYYRWSPSDPQWIQDIGTISPGDIIDLMVEVPTNTTYGVVIFKNRNTTQSSWQPIQPDFDWYPHCLGSAEWLISPYNDTAVLPNFGSIVFQNAKAIKDSGDSYLPQGATINDMFTYDSIRWQLVKNLTSTWVNGSSVGITYTG